MSRQLRTCHRAFTLIELLCVMTIIMILISMMLPAFGRALRKARGVAGHLGDSGGVQMRIEEVVASYTRYRAANPSHGVLSKRTFIRELQLSAAAEEWLNLKSVEYRPFASSDPLTQPAVIVYPSLGSGSGERLFVFTIGDLILR